MVKSQMLPNVFWIEVGVCAIFELKVVSLRHCNLSLCSRLGMVVAIHCTFVCFVFFVLEQCTIGKVVKCILLLEV